MGVLWVWTAVCMVIEMLEYLVSCFRSGTKEEVPERRNNHDQSYFKWVLVFVFMLIIVYGALLMFITLLH